MISPRTRSSGFASCFPSDCVGRPECARAGSASDDDKSFVLGRLPQMAGGHAPASSTFRRGVGPSFSSDGGSLVVTGLPPESACPDRPESPRGHRVLPTRRTRLASQPHALPGGSHSPASPLDAARLWFRPGPRLGADRRWLPRVRGVHCGAFDPFRGAVCADGKRHSPKENAARSPTQFTPSPQSVWWGWPFGAAPTAQTLPGEASIAISLRGRRGVSARWDSTDREMVAARKRAAFERTQKGRAVAPTERLTAPAADAASVLEVELRRLFERNGVIDLEEARALRLYRAVVRRVNRNDAWMEVVLSALHVDGPDSRNYQRKLREFHRDWD